VEHARLRVGPGVRQQPGDGLGGQRVEALAPAPLQTLNATMDEQVE
jgi:hypothetical protein